VLDHWPSKLQVLSLDNPNLSLLIYITGFKWNIGDSFIARLRNSHGPPPDEPAYDIVVGPLPYGYILVVPLLDIREGSMIRFVGGFEFNNWQDAAMADCMKTFLHYSFLESNRTLVFSDLQGACFFKTYIAMH
jgi:hypothetical protein